MRILILFFISGFSMFQLVFSQVKFQKGIEAGVNSSGTPWHDNYIIAVRNDHVKKSYMPLISPLFGIWGKAKFGRHFFSSLGVQYLYVGYKYHYHRDGNNLIDNTTYKHDEWENLTFHKLSMPLTLGYDFKVKKIKASAFLGYKKNYLMKGKYYSRDLFIEESDPTSSEDRTNTKDPFDKNHFTNPAYRWNSSMFIGIGANISKKINLNFTYSTNDMVYFGDAFGWEGHFHSYYNDDFTLIARYTIGSK